MMHYCDSGLDTKSVKILLIDDNEKTSKQVINYLKNKEYDITATNNVKNVLTLVLLKKFDLVILNLATADFVAYDTITDLEKNGQIPELNIVPYISSSFDADELEGLQKLIDGFELQ